MLVALPALAAGPDLEFYMTADREKVGTEDTFRVEIVVANAPEGAVLQFPTPEDFEVLGRSESTQMSFGVGPGGAGVIKQMRKHTLTLRANKTGKLTIPPAGLQTASKLHKTNALTIEVVKGRLGPDPSTQRRQQTPFGIPPGFPFDLDDDPFESHPFEDPQIPTSDSDLFLRSALDKPEVYVGEQVMLSIHIYSRVDLSSVDTVTMPKLEGFWSQDFKSPSQLMPERRVINGVHYNAYLLRQKALFPMKAGTATIEPAEADITTGIFMTGRRVHRKGNPLTIKVKPLPPGGNTNVVGRWRLSGQLSQTEVSLGDPVQLKLVLEGRGNLQAVQMPPLKAPPALKVFDPETTDKPSSSKAVVGGQRNLEYTIVPQQTGTFTLPGIALPYFDPESGTYEETRTDDFTLTVKPGAGGATAIGVPGVPVTALDGPKNQLIGGGLKSLRHTARFSGPQAALWSRPWFVPLALAPVALTLLAGALGLVRGAFGKETPESLKKKQAKAARKRLAAAEHLLKQGSTADFYAEVERALSAFIGAKLGAPVIGLTRTELDARLTEAGIAEPERKRIATVFDTCDTGRYAPGMGEAAARRRALEDAATAMEGWA